MNFKIYHKRFFSKLEVKAKKWARKKDHDSEAKPYKSLLEAVAAASHPLIRCKLHSHSSGSKSNLRFKNKDLSSTRILNNTELKKLKDRGLSASIMSLLTLAQRARKESVLNSNSTRINTTMRNNNSRTDRCNTRLPSIHNRRTWQTIITIKIRVMAIGR